MFHVKQSRSTAPALRRIFLAALGLCATVAALLALPAAPARAGTPSSEFPRLWQEAGGEDAKKIEVLDLLVKEKSADAAKHLLWVGLKSDEAGAVVDRAVQGLSELEGSPSADAWMKGELKKSGRWADRAVIIRAVARRVSPEAARMLRDQLKDRSWQVACAAIEGLRRHRTRETIEALLALWTGLDARKDETARVAGDIRDTLQIFTGKDFLTLTDAQAWWAGAAEGWKPDARTGSLDGNEAVTGERSPRLFDEVRSRKAMLILDTSGSMRVETGAMKDPKKAPNGLSRFEIMRREVKRVIEELPPSASFGMISFGSKVSAWKQGQLVVASDGNKRQAQKFVDALKTEGETNSHGALEEAFKNAEIDTVYFLSDGYPTAGAITDFNKIVEEVKKWNTVRNVRIHTIAFVAGDGKIMGVVEGDKSMPKEFMRKLAQENGGRYRLVE